MECRFAASDARLRYERNQIGAARNGERVEERRGHRYDSAPQADVLESVINRSPGWQEKVAECTCI